MNNINLAKLDNYSDKMHKYTPDMTADTYYTLDTTVSPDQTAVIPAMNGRQGDDMRAIPLAFVDGSQPHDLTNTKIELRVRDAAGIVKVSDKAINLVDPTGGLVVFGIPAEIYEAPGEVQRAYFVLTDKTISGDSQTISTVSVDFTVLENGIDITKRQSSIYISALDKVLDKGGSYAVTNADNIFTETNNFNIIKASHISAPEITQAQSDVTALSTSAVTASKTIDSVRSQVTANSTATSSQIRSVTKSVMSAVSGIPNTVKSTIDSQTKSVTSQLSTISNNASQASVTASAAMATVEDKADQDSLDSLSEYVDSVSSQGNTQDLQNSIASNSTAISTLSQSVYQLDQSALSASNAISLQTGSLKAASTDAKAGSAVLEQLGFLVNNSYSDFSAFWTNFKNTIQEAQSHASQGF